MADGEWRERRRGGERGRYLHARREQGVGVGGGTQARRGIGQEVPISIFLTARTQHRGVIVAARRTQCCTQASRRAGVPDRGGFQGPGSLSPPKVRRVLVGGGTSSPPRSACSAVQYLATGTSGALQLPSSRAPGTTTQTHRHTHSHSRTHPHTTHTHTARQEWSVRGVPIHDAQASSTEACKTHTNREPRCVRCFVFSLPGLPITPA